MNTETATQWILDQQQPALERLMAWCDQNSWSMDQANLVQMADTLATDFASFGVEFERVDLPDLRLLGDSEDWDRAPTGPALLWHHHPGAAKAKRVLLMIHYDTVYPAGTEPSTCRLHQDPTSMQQRLVGPGVADAKGGIAVIALAVEAMLKFGLLDDIGLSILLNPDEEIGSTASAALIKELCPQFGSALLFEPSLPDGSLVANRKGSGNFSIVVRGKSAHAGRNPEMGRNAIVRLAEVIQRLQKHHHPSEGVTINVGNICGGGALNRVPDHATAKLNVRVIDRDAQLKVESELESIAEDFSGDGYVVKTLGEFHCPPKRVDARIGRIQQVVEKAASLAGQPAVRWQDTGGACDGSKLAAWGLPNIDTMGVCGGNLHSPDEFMIADSLATSAVQTMLSVLLAAAD
ncbi:Carboxypeptidase G2 precursor [Rubripirellula obstinata]|uniref:Carboxypeptidase G2 n=1 Tax=Rubripirellula obstinata TaxID=406547 RepID=A0A5B1CNJ5_9BACT|nr:hydrolase [Rubripirellula obstinata]KAA1261369.1 Carboxypeptidase G2 precursor [Rubripirellula obstinata]